MISFRTMVAGDIPAGLSLCRHAGWNQTAHDWELFLQLSPIGCRVAVNDNNRVVGTVGTVTYQKNFSWIGMVLVDPQSRRQGIGTKLLQEALQILKNEETVKLDATPEGREVYLQLGFIDEYPLSRMNIASVRRETPAYSNVVPMRKEDLVQVSTFDQNIFGADRLFILTDLLKRAPHLAFITKIKDEVSGFCFGRRGHNFTHIGPVVSTNVGDSMNLVSAAMKNCDEHSIILDVPHHTPAWTNWLTAIGFSEQRPFIRMYRGKNFSQADSEKHFAILGPEFG
ncbi:MAG TPA: GNAT family N-acetyltransferase [Cyclobacteriaceae bacterium]|nr:GNAT family N-acetyltransferase [Cyclobacteriaceae bacterium]